MTSRAAHAVVRRRLPEDFELPETLVEEDSKQRFAMMLSDLKERGQSDEKLKELITPENYERYKKIARCARGAVTNQTSRGPDAIDAAEAAEAAPTRRGTDAAARCAACGCAGRSARRASWAISRFAPSARRRA